MSVKFHITVTVIEDVFSRSNMNADESSIIVPGTGTAFCSYRRISASGGAVLVMLT